MKTYLPVLLSALVLPCSSLAKEEDYKECRLTAQAIVIALPKAAALRFLTENDLNGGANEAFKSLMTLVEKNQAKSAANLATSGRSAQRVTSQGRDTKMEIEMTISADHDVVHVNIKFDYRGNMLTANTVSKPGDVVFLGSLDDIGKDAVSYLVFVRCTVAWI